MIRSLSVFAASLFLINTAFADSVEERAVRDFIVPGYQAFEQAAEDQILKMGTLCTNNDQRSLDAARQSFSQLVDRWSHIEVIRFGPILEENRLERILFWPDRKSIGLKQTQRAIAQKDETTTSLDSLQQKSVALQGLGALEFVLYGTGARTDLLQNANYRCHFGLTIASAVYDVASETSDAWQDENGFALSLTRPTLDAKLYRDKDETVREVLGVVAHGPGIFYDTRLKKYLGDQDKPSKPKSALFWRSNLTFKSLSSNVAALGEFAQVADFNLMLDAEKHWVADSYIFEASNAQRALKIENAVLDTPSSKERSKLEYLKVVLGSMAVIATEDLSQALGQSAGFSSLDGD